MEFISKSGIRINYWFTVGDVTNVKSWRYRGERHHEVWIRNTDGREWLCNGFPLNVPLTKGQRIAFAWGAPENTANGQLVGAKNCSTGCCHLLSQSIATDLGVHRYGRRMFYGLTTVATLFWAIGGGLGQPSWTPLVAAMSTAAAILGGSLLGFLFSCFLDPDPARVIDRNVVTALEGIELAWLHTERTSTGRGGRMRSIA